MARQAFLPPVTGGNFGLPETSYLPAYEGPSVSPMPPTAPVAQAAVKPVTSPAARDNATGIMSGLAAASQIQPGNDVASGATSALASGLTAGGTAFVASGFNPLVGLAAGGGATLASLVNSWMTTKATRKRDRDRKRLLDETQRRQDERDRIARQDGLEQQGYDRRQAAVQAAWGKNVETMKRLNDTINQNQSLKDRFIKLGHA